MAIFAKRPSPHQPLDERKIRPLSGSDSISGRTLLTLLTLLVVGLVTFSYSGIVPPPLPESPSGTSEPSAAAGGNGGGVRATAEDGDPSSPWEHDGDVESERDGTSEEDLQLAESPHVRSSGDGGDEAAAGAEDEAEAEGGGGKNAGKDGEGGRSGSSGEEGDGGVEGPEGDDFVDEGGDGGEAEGDTVGAVAEGEGKEGDGETDALDEGVQDEDEGGQGSPAAEGAAKKPKAPSRCAVTPEIVAFTMNQLNNTVGRPARGSGAEGKGHRTPQMCSTFKMGRGD